MIPEIMSSGGLIAALAVSVPSPLLRRIVKTYRMRAYSYGEASPTGPPALETDRALRVYAQHFREEYKPALGAQS